jgi:uncharacterized membrane protein
MQVACIINSSPLCYPLFLILRFIVRLLLAALFLFAGTVHLRHPEWFLPIMPPWIPYHRTCIEISGVLELLGGIGLLIPVRSIQWFTGWGLALMLVAVFPANIYMAMAHIQVHGIPSQPWMAWARLPLQPLLIVAVLWVSRAWQGKCIKESLLNKHDTPP